MNGLPENASTTDGTVIGTMSQQTEFIFINLNCIGRKVLWLKVLVGCAFYLGVGVVGRRQNNYATT